MLDIIKAIVLGIVEGITEWLPISSTGHMILVDEFLKLGVSEEFKNMFFVIIQLGAVMAVVVMYWSKLIPWKIKDGFEIKKDILSMWGKIIVACIPAGVIGVFFDDWFEKYLYNYVTVAIMLILVGIAFIIVENYYKDKSAKINAISEITYNVALIIGVFQLLAAIFPGTSRSGATIIGALLIGVSRSVAAEFTFFLAIPVMFGASLLKVVKYVLDYGFNFSVEEIIILLTGMGVAYLVSVFAIKFLMGYIKKHDFKIFGWYRIGLGIIVLGYFIFVSICK